MRFIPNWCYSFLQRLRVLAFKFGYDILKFRRISEKVIFYSNNRRTLEGNMAIIYNNLPHITKKVYCIKNNIFDKIKLLFDISNAKYIIVDDYVPLLYSLKIRKNSKFIQVWHATGAFKKFGFARTGLIGGPKKTSITHKNYTDVVVGSTNLIKIYADSFGISESKVHALGEPKTDYFYDKKWLNNCKEKFYNHYPNCKNKKTILFAPTFRGNGIKSANYNLVIDYDTLYKEFSKDYVILIKLHPFIKTKLSIDNKYSDFLIDISSIRDIDEFLCVTDILITDYSSVIFDYSLFKKPLILYVPDLEEYKKSRDFYFEFEDYNYGSIANNMEELVNQIKNPKVDIKKIKELNNIHMNMCDGSATKRFINTLIK